MIVIMATGRMVVALVTLFFHGLLRGAWCLGRFFAEQRRLFAQELAITAAQLRLVVADPLAASFVLRMSAISCSVSMMIWRWLRSDAGFTSDGIAALSSSASCSGAGRRTVYVGDCTVCARPALSVARTKKYSSSPGSIASSLRAHVFDQLRSLGLFDAGSGISRSVKRTFSPLPCASVMCSVARVIR
jgi:hypothetical protein